MSRGAEDARLACRSAIAATALNLVGTSFYAMFVRATIGAPLWPCLQSIGVSAALLVVLLARRRSPSARLGSIAFLLNNAAILVGLWVTGKVLAASGRPWVPFQPQKLGALAVALLAPPRLWVGALSIAAFTGIAVAQLALFDAAVRRRLPIDEPWASLAYGIFALGLLIYRLRGRALERAMARAQAEAAALERLTRTVLAVRDMANTPLQTLELNLALMSRRSSAERSCLDRMRQALERLRELNRLLDEEEMKFPCRSGDESFDPRAILGRGNARKQDR